MKKRMVLWVGGAIAVAVALFAATVFLIGYNSTDARIERAEAQIADEYGFEFIGKMPGWDARGSRAVGKGYSRAPMSAEEADEIVAILRDACPSCKYEHTVYDEDNLPVSFSGGDPLYESHSLKSKELEGGGADGVAFNPDTKGFGFPDIEPEAVLLVVRLDRPSLWERIKGLWPW